MNQRLKEGGRYELQALLSTTKKSSQVLLVCTEGVDELVMDVDPQGHKDNQGEEGQDECSWRTEILSAR